jgi:hypothetical protein
MSRVQLPIMVLDPATGAAVSGASVTVTLRSTGAAASVFSSDAGGTAGTNVLTTDANGRVGSKWVERGQYDLSVTGTGITAYTVTYDAAPTTDSSVAKEWIGTGQVEAAELATGAVTLVKLASDAALTHYSSLPTGTSFTAAQQITIPSPDGNGRWAFVWGGSSDQYWYFTGGAPAAKSNKGLSLVNASSTANNGIAITGVSLTLPNKGKYLIETSAEINAATGTNVGSLAGHGTSATDAETYFAEQLVGVSGASNQLTGSTAHVRDFTTTANTVSTYFRGRVGSVTCKSGSLRVTPVRLDPA